MVNNFNLYFFVVKLYNKKVLVNFCKETDKVVCIIQIVFKSYFMDLVGKKAKAYYFWTIS